MKKLVAFYSRADENYFQGKYRYITVGNTEKVAKVIAKETGAELFKIEQKIPYAQDYQTCISQAKKDLNNHVRPEIMDIPHDISKYDEIYLGYPNYWGDLPIAVYTFLESFKWDGKIIHPFCTHEGSGLGQTVYKIETVCKGAVVIKGLAIYGSEAGKSEDVILDWIKK